ncbi:MAG: hypothetical protein KAS62_11005 [Candidatus Delongbacteria bacterium]|nr:hypothetical protein [Candidatus Delongbacteria bacterium]
MYKFNFLQKINDERIETGKRNKFITTIFLISATAQLILLALLFLKSTSVNTSYKEAIAEKSDIEKQTSDFRNKGFFAYKSIQHLYNIQISRRQLSYIFKSIENSIDSTMIIERFDFEGSHIEIDIIAREKISKSKLMTKINQLKSKLSDNLLSEEYIIEARNIKLDKGPNLKNDAKNNDGTQYWLFKFDVALKLPEVGKKKKKVKKPPKMHV